MWWCKPYSQDIRQEDEMFKVVLHCTVNLRPLNCSRHCLKGKRRKRKELEEKRREASQREHTRKMENSQEGLPRLLPISELQGREHQATLDSVLDSLCVFFLSPDFTPISQKYPVSWRLCQIHTATRWVLKSVTDLLTEGKVFGDLPKSPNIYSQH